MRATWKQIPRRYRRGLTAAALAAAALGATVNLWLLFGGAAGVTTPKTHVRWSRAWMLIPGHLSVKDLRISSQTPTDHWQLEIERTQARVSLFALLTRQLVIKKGAAAGAEFRLRRRPLPGTDLTAVSPYLPPIDGFPISHREPRRDKKKNWRFTLNGLEFRDVKKLWADSIEVRNPGSTGLVSGDAHFVVRGLMSMKQVRYALDGGELWLGGARIAESLDVRSEFSLRPMRPADLRRPESFGNLDGRVEVRGSVGSLVFLKTLLSERLQELDLQGGGRLDARVHIAGGQIMEPSTLGVETTDLDVRFGAYRGRGRGRIDAAVTAPGESPPSSPRPSPGETSSAGGDLEDDAPADQAPDPREPDAAIGKAPIDASPDPRRRLTAHIRLDDLRVDAGLEPSDTPPEPGDEDREDAGDRKILEAAGLADRFQVQITGFDPALGRPLADPEILLELPAFEIPDLETFDPLVPAGLDFKILGGRALVAARLSLSAEEENTVFDIVADDARLRYRGTRIDGTLQLSGRSVGRLDASDAKRTRVHGLNLRFDGATRPRRASAASSPVAFELAFGPIDLELPRRTADRTRLRLLNDDLEVTGRFDDLGWWDIKGKMSQGLHLRGRGTLEARLGLDHAKGRPRISRDRELTLRITRFDLPDLTEFRDLLPSASGLRLDGGRGVARGRFTLRGRRESLNFTVDAKDVSLSFRDTPFRGDLKLSGRSFGAMKSDRVGLRDVALEFSGETVRGADADGEGGESVQVGETRPVRFRLDLGDTDIRLPNAKAGRKLRLADGFVEIEGHVDDLGWWDTPIAGEDWLRLEGRASLAARLRVQETGAGITLGAPSEITATLPDLVAMIGDWRAAARGELRGALESSGSRLALELDGPTLSQEGHPTLSLPTLRLEAEGPRLSRGRSMDGVRVALVAEPTEVPDLSVLNGYLPEGKFQFDSGAGALEGRLDLSRNNATVAFELHSDGAVAEVSGKTVSSRVDLEVDLRSADPSSRRLEIYRGEVRLRDVLFADIPNPSPDWWAVGTIRDGWVTAAKPIALNTEVEMRLRDPQPIVHLVGEKRRSVRWLARVLDIDDVSGTGRMILDEGGLRFEDLNIRGEDLVVRGHIDLEEPVRALLLIQYHQFFVGVEKVGDDSNLRLFRPTEWYDERSRAWKSRVR